MLGKEEENLGVKVGDDYYTVISKPFDPDKFIKTVHEALKE